MFLRFSLASIHDSFNNEIIIPNDLVKYFYDYSHSEFVECNYVLAQNVSTLFNGSMKQNTEKNNKIFPCILELAKTLEGMYKNYWLTAGALLGWYRECGITPFIDHIDITMQFNEYDSKLQDKLRSKNPNIYLWVELGRKKNYMQSRLGGCGFTYDVFLLYETNPGLYCNYFHYHQLSA